MAFRSSHIRNDYMSREQSVRQADTQYALVTLKRVNQGYSQFYYKEGGGISLKTNYSDLKQYNNKFKTSGYRAWIVYHMESLPNVSTLKDPKYQYTVSDSDTATVEKKESSTSNGSSKTKGSSSSKSSSTGGNKDKTENKYKVDKDKVTTTVKGTTTTITRDVNYDGKPVMKRQTLVRKTKGLKYGVLQIEYYAPEHGEYSIEAMYGTVSDSILENDVYIDGVKQSRGNPWNAYREIMNRHTNTVKLDKGKHIITFKLDSRSIIYGLGVKKIETFKADTLNDEYLTLWEFSVDKSSEEVGVTEASITLLYENFMDDTGKPYFCDKNQSGLLFDYRDEVTIKVKNNNGDMVNIFGGYVSSIELDDEGMEVTLSCADRLIDCQNRYTLTELLYKGGNNENNQKEYSLSKKRYFTKYGDIVDFLLKSTEYPIKNNVNDRTGDVVGEFELKGANVEFKGSNTNTWKNVAKTAKNIKVSTDSSNVKTRTNYMELRNQPTPKSHQEITLFDYTKNKFNLDYYNINTRPYLTVEYAMGDPKTTYQVCSSTGDGSDVVGDENGFGDGSTTMAEIANVGASFRYGGRIGDHDPIHAWNVYHMKKGQTGDCYDVTAWAYYVYNFKAGIWARDVVGKGDAGSGTHHVIQIRSNGKWVFPEWYHRCTTNLRLTEAMKNGDYKVARDVPTGRLKYPAYRNKWYGNRS